MGENPYGLCKVLWDTHKLNKEKFAINEWCSGLKCLYKYEQFSYNMWKSWGKYFIFCTSINEN